MDQERIEGEHADDVETVPDGRFLRLDESWAEGVKEELECAVVSNLRTSGRIRVG